MSSAALDLALSPALAVRGLVVRYGERTVLSGVDMTVPAGEIRVILGGSGSGKSTLLKGILGLTDVSAGSVTLLGQPMLGLPEAERQRLMQRVGVLFQNGALFGSLTVGENVALPLREHRRLPEGAIRELVRSKLAQVAMSHAEHLYPAELSGGMKKRAGLARALALDPEVLFCDEPSAGLDPQTSLNLDNLLLQLRDRLGVTVVIVTHELASIEGIADSLIMIGAGKVIAEGAVAEVRRRGLAQVDDFFARTAQLDASPEVSAAELLGLTARGGA
jgi:phospholipid/cholesterol/gamma-HCH transport system ATP-binding protein